MIYLKSYFINRLNYKIYLIKPFEYKNIKILLIIFKQSKYNELSIFSNKICKNSFEYIKYFLINSYLEIQIFN